MSEINRSLIVLKPKQPFLDWAHSLDEERNKFTLQELAHDSIAYLIPELWEDADEGDERNRVLLLPARQLLTNRGQLFATIA